MRVAQIGHIAFADGVKAGGGKDQDRGVDEQGKGQRHRAVERGKAQSHTLFRQGLTIGAGLHDGGMQIKIVRHHGGTKYPQCQIQHVGVGDDVGGWGEAFDHIRPDRVCHPDLDGETDGNHPQQGDDKGFQPAKALFLQPQDQKHVKRRDDDAQFQRNAEQKVEADGGADHLGNVGGDDRQFGGGPQRPDQPARKGIAAGLCQIAARCDGQPGAQRLQHDGHQVADQCHHQQRIAEF